MPKNETGPLEILKMRDASKKKKVIVYAVVVLALIGIAMALSQLFGTGAP